MQTTQQQHSVSISSLELLPLEEVTPLAGMLARRFAHREADVDDLVQVGLIAYHRSEARLRGQPIRKQWALARTILQRAMVGYYYYTYPKIGRFLQWNTNEFKRYAPVEAIDAVASTDMQAQLFELEDYFAAVEKAFGPQMRRVAENLVEPRDPDVVEYILNECKDKMRLRMKHAGKSAAAKRRLHLPRGGGAHYPIRVTQTQIGAALGYAPWQWARILDTIRDFTRAWLDRNGTITPAVRTA